MRKLIASFLICFVTTASAQVQFQDISYEEALNRSNTVGKLIFLQIEGAGCAFCNEIADKSFSNPELASQIEETFIPVKIGATHADRSKLMTQFNVKEIGTLFINQSGVLIHAFRKTTSNANDYKKQIDIALEKAGESLKINELETEYKSGNKSPRFLETLLLKRRSLNLPTEELLEEYVRSLPSDSLKSARVLKFIVRLTPLLNSNANKMLRQDRLLFSQAWYQLSLPERIAINNSIISKSIIKAINARDESYAKQVASFAQGTYTSNSIAAVKAYDKNLLRYYEETGDTATYFKKAIAYYERYYMTVSVDSIKKIDKQNIAKVFHNGKTDTVRAGNKITITSAVRYAPIAQRFTNELNTGAWNFYKMTNNSYLLSVATEWAIRAQEFYTAPEAMDTYARLLYKQGQKPKAIELEKAAIVLMQKRGYATKEYEAVLDKMTKGATNIE